MQPSGKIFRIIFLIFIPSVIALCSYVYGYNYFGAIATGNYFNLSSNYTAFTSLLCAMACYLAVVIYGLYPVTFTIQKYAKSYQDTAAEYEFIKKVLFNGNLY